MKIILLSASILLSVILSAGPDVYICNNGKTKKYHNSPACKGLKRCQFKIVKISAQTAKKNGMTLCAWEGKK